MDAATLDKEILDLAKNHLVRGIVSVDAVKRFVEFRAVDRVEIAASLKRLKARGRLVETSMAGVYIPPKKSRQPTPNTQNPAAPKAAPKAKSTPKAKPAKKPKKRTFSDWFWGRK